MSSKHLTNQKILEVILAQPRGFCAGVERAIEIVTKTLEKYGAPIYVHHEIVHNKYVVDHFKSRGVIFVDTIEEIPEKAITIYSAHGVSEQVEQTAKLRKLPIIDATCPLVTKVHKEAQKNEKEDYHIILIGHAGHPEVIGTSGRVKKKVILVESTTDVEKINLQASDKISYVTQTTLSVDDTKNIIAALKKKFPNIKGPGLKDICYATQNRQDAVKKLATMVDMIFVIGSPNSSNSNRLKILAEQMGTTSYLINGPDDIQKEWLHNVSRIGITAGASAPETLTEKVLKHLDILAPIHVSTMNGKQEDIKFKLPKELSANSKFLATRQKITA